MIPLSPNPLDQYGGPKDHTIRFGSSPYTMMTKIYKTMYLERDKIIIDLVRPINELFFMPFMVHIILWVCVVLLWTPWLTNGPLSYLVLALLLCVHLGLLPYGFYPKSYFLLYGFINKTFGPFFILWFYLGKCYFMFWPMIPYLKVINLIHVTILTFLSQTWSYNVTVVFL